MTAEPDETPVEPTIAPASAGRARELPDQPDAASFEQRPASLGGLLRPLAAGVIAGLLGGGIVAFLVAGAGIGPKADEQARLLIKELQDKIKDQQDKTAQLGDALRAKLAEAPVKAASPEELSEVRSRLEEISKSEKAEEDSVQALSQKVQELDQKPAPPLDKEAVQSEVASQMAPVAERLAGVERAQSEKASEVADRLAGVERAQSEKAAEVTDRLAGVERAQSEKAAEVTDRLAGVERAQSEKASEVADRLTGLERNQNEKASDVANRLAGIERTQSERVADARTATITIALASLKRAVSEGKPFATELATVESLSSDKLPVSELASNKEAGVPSISQLQHEFVDTVRNAIVQHYHGKSNSFFDEVLSRARGAVQVKPIGGAGDTVEAVLGRMEKALKAGDLKSALTESASLEGPAKEELHKWLDQAQARLAADEAVRKTEQDLLASLAKASATH